MYQQEITLRSDSEFTRMDNKGRLWKILQNNGAFNGIDNSFFSKVREEFEITIVEIEKQHSLKNTLEKSKIFIDSMVVKLKTYKHRNHSVGEISNATDISQLQTTDIVSNVSKNTQMSVPPYTSDDLKQSRLDAFDKELQQKQSEFDVYNAKPKPQNVDFKDNNDSASEDVSKLLEKAMREREELNTVPNAVPNAVPISTSLSSPIKKDNTNEEMFLKIMSKLEEIHRMLNEEREKK